MTAPATCRMILEPRANRGSWNMAVDEALLETAVDDGDCVVRLYTWDQATVSLGYFQNASELEGHPNFASLPAVRRLTGGGALLHHFELTYSCVIPATHPLSEIPSELYVRMHDAAVNVLRDRGIMAQRRGDRLADREGEFLCFGRGDPRDVVVNGHKILGSAQRRRRGAVLQHGALILSASPYAPQFPGVVELVDVTLNLDGLEAELLRRLSAGIAVEAIDSALTPAEQIRVQQLEESRYRSLIWQGSRDPQISTVSPATDQC